MEHTYEGVNEQLRQEMKDRREEMDEMLDSLSLRELDG